MLDKIPAEAAADNKGFVVWADMPSNKRVNPAVRPVTGVAEDATPAPIRPAGYARRWTVKNSTEPNGM
jgi:hypothetical protein